jgi:hypothetical protein
MAAVSNRNSADIASYSNFFINAASLELAMDVVVLVEVQESNTA